MTNNDEFTDFFVENFKKIKTFCNTFETRIQSILKFDKIIHYIICATNVTSKIVFSKIYTVWSEMKSHGGQSSNSI